MSGLYQRTTQSLEGLTDVDITNIQDGQAPVYDATSQVYTNQTVLTPSDLPSGSSGDVIISDGTGGLNSTSRLNVNPANGYITGDYVKVNSNTIKLGSGALTATDAIAIGYQAGFGGKNGSVSVGSGSGITAGNSSISVGNGAIAVDNNSIVINATGSTLLSSFASSCYIDPLRDITVGSLSGLPFIVHYDNATKEMFKAVDIQTRNAFVKGFLTVDSTASLYSGQLTAGVGGNKIVAGATNNNLVVDLTNQRVAINKATPDEELDINGTLRIEADTTQTIRFYDTQGGGSPDEDGRIEVTQDGGGGEMKFYTLETGGGTPQERLSINRRGALGLSGNYGLANQVLTSNDAGNAVSWTTPTAPPPSAFGAFNLAFNFTITGTKTINNIIDDTAFPTPFGMTKTGNQNIQLTQAGVYRFTWSISWNYTSSGSSLSAFLIKTGTTNIHRSSVWLGPTWGTISGSRVINVTAGQTFYFEGQTVSSFLLLGGSEKSSISIIRLF